jgi:hypothetical protein
VPARFKQGHFALPGIVFPPKKAQFALPGNSFLGVPAALSSERGSRFTRNPSEKSLVTVLSFVRRVHEPARVAELDGERDLACPIKASTMGSGRRHADAPRNFFADRCCDVMLQIEERVGKPALCEIEAVPKNVPQSGSRPCARSKLFLRTCRKQEAGRAGCPWAVLLPLPLNFRMTPTTWPA